MQKKRLWKTAITVIAMLVSALATVTPANAAPTNYSVSITLTGNTTLVFTPSTLAVEVNDVITLTNNTGANIEVIETFGGTSTPGDGATVANSATVAVTTASNLGMPGKIRFNAIYNASRYGPQEFAWTYSQSAPPSPSSDSTVASAPAEASLSLDLAASGASCKDGSAATGTVGQWLKLPGADDCTSTTRSDAKLLGWSTSKDFPVTIAQRQVTNGWGSYELTNETGGVTAVFIPAGRATFVSSGNSLFPIWAR